MKNLTLPLINAVQLYEEKGGGEVVVIVLGETISFFVFDWTMVHHDQIAGDIIAVFWPHSPALEVCQRAQIGFSFPPTRCVYRLWSFKLME